MNQTVLILADDVEFGRTVMARWQTERSVPGFAVVSGDVWNGANSAPYDLAIVADVRPALLTSILKALDAAAKPVIYAAPEPFVQQSISDAHPRILVLRRHQGWVDNLVVLGGEVLRRVEATARARRAEQISASSERFAALGRYMLEMRHRINNALTSLLGNAELLLLEPSAFSPEAREQIDTIHAMGLRMHEIMQRFSSLETEMQFAEKKDSQGETKLRAGEAASGS